MKVLLVSTSERAGGGAIAASRLMEALNHNGVKAKMLVRDKQTDSITVAAMGNKAPKALERLFVLLHNGFNRKTMWQADIANVGIDITRTAEYREADVIHLHWVNQGMLSLSVIEKILRDGKKVVWTLHDEWPYLGVCHYRGDCMQQECCNCPLMCGNLPHKLWQRKRRLYALGNITFVGCSQWITDEAKKALPGADVIHIPNCIPHSIFRPMDRSEARTRLQLPQDRKIVLFCSQNVRDERKGMRFMDEALQELSGVEVVRIGKGYRYISNPQEMAMMYAAADVFVTPSLQDNLPNTIAEAMSCGTPCVGFNVGGIPEMIDHLHTGYVARYKDSRDLAEGIRYVLSHDLREAAHQAASKAYSETHTAQEYMKVYGL